MKTKLIGLGILLTVIISVTVFVFVSGGQNYSEISGYVGGEKIGLLEDEEVSKLIKDRYKLTIDYSKAGSIDMITADRDGKNFLFPSSQTALEIYNENYGKPVKSEIIFNTPIVLYTRKEISQALLSQKIAYKQGDVFYVDMKKLIECIESEKTWADIGLTQLYGNISVGTTDPVKSNSGNMFAGIVANTLCGGTADEISIVPVLPRLKQIYHKLGYMESSSSDLFDQFLKTGMGAKPLIAGYENQLLEFAMQSPDIWGQIKDDIVMLYPNPTVWSSHVYIALDEEGKAGIEALTDPDVQRLAWERHGFRTGVNGATIDTSIFGVDGIEENISRVTSMPNAKTMDVIINALR